MSIVYVAVLGVLAHYIGESLPRGRFSESGFIYRARNWEKGGTVYECLGIRKWKTRLPDMSRIMRDMLPKKVTFDATSESVGTLIKETCVAEFIHNSLSVLSLGIYFIWKNYIGIILILVFLFCNTPFVLIQRYNRPHLAALKKRLLKREAVINGALTDTVV